MKRKIAAFAATFLMVLALVGISGTSNAKPQEPAQAWYYSTCTAIETSGWRWCFRICVHPIERHLVGKCHEWVRVNQWNA